MNGQEFLPRFGLSRKHDYSSNKRGNRDRRGVITVLAAVLMVVMLALVAFAVDLGIIFSAHTDMKRATDAAALAGASALVEGTGEANLRAFEYSVRNPEGVHGLAEDDDDWLANIEALLAQHEDEFETQSGHWDAETHTFVESDQLPSTIRAAAARNDLPLFFARVLGQDKFAVAAESIAQYQPRDIAVVLDFSASMNDDSELKRIDWGGSNRSEVEDSLREIYEDLGAPVYGNMTFAPQYISTTDTTEIKKQLGLLTLQDGVWREVPYPYPSGSWNDYIYYVKTSYNVYRAGYRKSYGYMTLANYWLEKKPTNAQTPDLWKANAQPIGAVKDAFGVFMEYIQAVDTDDRVALVIYNSPSQQALVEHSLTNDFEPLKNTVLHRQAGHYDQYTNIGDGIRYAREELDANGRPGAFKMIAIMTDGIANRPWGLDAREYAKQQAALAEEAGYTVMTISLGTAADTALMQTIADSTDGEHYNVAGGSEVEDYHEELLDAFREIANSRPLILVK